MLVRYTTQASTRDFLICSTWYEELVQTENGAVELPSVHYAYLIVSKNVYESLCVVNYFPPYKPFPINKSLQKSSDSIHRVVFLSSTMSYIRS